MEVKFEFFIVIAATLTILASCAVTTGSTEGTSETFINTSEVSTKFTSSTSPRSKGDSKKPVDTVTEYIRLNMARLRADMAVGHGEYLITLAVLMKISDAQKPAFYKMTKEKFYVLFASSNTTAEELLNKLYLEISLMPAS